MFTVSVLISESKWHPFSLLSSAIFNFDAEAFRIFWRVFKGDNLVIEDYLWTLTNDGFKNNFLTILLAYHVVCFITMSNLLRSDLHWQAENERDCKNDYSAWEIEQWGVKRRHKYTRTDIRHCVLRRLVYEHKCPSPKNAAFDLRTCDTVNRYTTEWHIPLTTSPHVTYLYWRDWTHSKRDYVYPYRRTSFQNQITNRLFYISLRFTFSFIFASSKLVRVFPPRVTLLEFVRHAWDRLDNGIVINSALRVNAWDCRFKNKV